MSEFRYSPLNDSYVLIADNRSRRPDVFSEKRNKIIDCPFDEGNESMTPEEAYAIREHGKKNGAGWKIRVVPNLYAPVSKTVPESCDSEYFKIRDGCGYAEIIIETPIHNQTMDSYSINQFELYFQAIINRIVEISKDKRIKLIQIFKNNGPDSGASQTHQHSQIIAIPFIPKEIVNRFKRLKRYYEKNGSSYFYDLVEHEVASDKRVVLKNADFVAICPYDSKTPFEIMIVPTGNMTSMIFMNNQEIVSLAEIFKKLMAALRKKLRDFSFNIIFNEPPLRYRAIEKFFRFYINIIPKLTVQGGFEQATGIFINPQPPEKAAKELRTALNYGAEGRT